MPILSGNYPENLRPLNSSRKKPKASKKNARKRPKFRRRAKKSNPEY